MLDRVAACHDRVLLPFTAEDMARRLFPEPMRLVDERLQDRERIGQLVVRLARGIE